MNADREEAGLWKENNIDCAKSEENIVAIPLSPMRSPHNYNLHHSWKFPADSLPEESVACRPLYI